jgi:hypothetical protein
MTPSGIEPATSRLVVQCPTNTAFPTTGTCIQTESRNCLPLHHRHKVRTYVIPHPIQWKVTFHPFLDPVSSHSCLSSRHSSPPSFRPSLYGETILDKYRSQHAVTAEQLHYINHSTVQHCFNICPKVKHRNTCTNPTHIQKCVPPRYRAAMKHFTPYV